MIMNSLKIQIPEGFKVGNFNKETGEVTFIAKPKEIKELIKTFDDVLKYHGLNSNSVDFTGTVDEIAYKKLKLVARALNEGWEPDWSDSDQPKYYPWFNMERSASGGFSYNDCDHNWTYSTVGSRLCFKSADLAKYAGTQFKDLYEDYFVIK